MKQFRKSIFCIFTALVLCMSTLLSACGETGQTPSASYVLTLDLNGGILPLTSLTLEEGENVFDAVEGLVPVKEGFTFEGWYEGDSPLAENRTMTNDFAVTAHWEEEEKTLYTLILELDGGTLSVSSLTLEEGENVFDAVEGLVPVKDGYTFEGWYEGNSPLAEDRTMTGDLTLRAHYTQETPSDDPEAALYSYRPRIFETVPAVRIDTVNEADGDFITKYRLSDKRAGLIEYVAATISVDGCDSEYALSGIEAQVKVRGNYTLDEVKKPVRIKFTKKQNMLGLNEGQKFKNWVLLADWKDRSMLKNVEAFYLGQTILGSDGYYCSDFCNVELYVNGQYWGLYLLAEQQEVKDDARASVPEVEDGYTGADIGYFFEFDGYAHFEDDMPNGDGDPTFYIDYMDYAPVTKLNGSPLSWTAIQNDPYGYTIKSDIYAEEQRAFLETRVENIYEILYHATVDGKFYKIGADGSLVADTNPSRSPLVTIDKVIDVKSLVDAYILSEIVCDPDIDNSSFYFSLDMTATGKQKLVFEAPWDFDSAFNDLGEAGVSSGRGDFVGNLNNPWLALVANQDWFLRLVKDKWNKLVKYGVLETSLSLIDTYNAAYQSDYLKNIERWPGLGNSSAQTQEAGRLKGWLTNRFAYLNSKWGSGPLSAN